MDVSGAACGEGRPATAIRDAAAGDSPVDADHAPGVDASLRRLLSRERFSAIYALLGIGMVPLSLAAVHLAGTIHHPTVFHRDGPAMERSMFVTFLVSWAGFILLGFALWRLELRGKLLAQGVQRLEKRLRGEAVLP